MNDLTAKKAITEENNKADMQEWFEQANEQTFETLPAFIKHVMDDYIHDYGTVCHAISACAVATAWACNKMEGSRGGITGFQADFVMWGFIKHWCYEHNKCGMKLVNYDDFLYPQYAHKYEKTISNDVWKSIQKQAKAELEKVDEDKVPFRPANSVIKHWKSIANGVIPFGYTIADD